MVENSTVLIADDDEDILVAGKLLLKRHFSSVITTTNPETIPELMAHHSFDAILLDMNFSPGESSGKQGLTWLEAILEIDPSAVVVMITAHGTMDLAIDVIKRGATDFIVKPWQNAKMLATVSAGVELSLSRKQTHTLQQKSKVLSAAATGPNQALLGTSAPIKKVQSLIERTAPTSANILILGENGTGKELAARAVHYASKRADKIFMSVDLGTLTEALFEAELFGHKKGAFTNATEDRMGKFQAAEGGSLFLDEIGNLPLHLQAKLLTALEQREVTPVGSNKPVPIDVRIIAATNMSAEKLYNEDYFRQDLLFRLNTVEITMPPLRDHPEDIAEIAYHYAEFYCRKYNMPSKRLTAACLDVLTQHAWPGNVRALRHAIERAVILSGKDSDSFALSDFQIQSVPAALERENDTDLNLKRLECRSIEIALKKHGYNVSHTAKELGLTRAALYRRMEKYGL
ncbi:sigma-54-dependent transcriptional regulator [Kordiimonas pumila]|uniref:Sigma-54-dependent transcriptional regulator n=1 Tax=Kordiimonas pumila TaxID=2161677 RepID=A0ABV7D5F2_9PROT|nr:sigma-54 dependent transcriptional regulator [Kordiimonas pumila]